MRTHFRYATLGTLILALVISILLSSTLVHADQQSNEPMSKIEPLLLEELALTGRTDFFIWIREKADLSPASQFTTKQEKGRFVFETLRRTAERTQKALREELDQLGVAYRPFYISNKIFVYGGDSSALFSIATRSDVARITANHTIELIRPFVSPEPPTSLAGVESNIRFIQADKVWALGFTGQGIVLAGNDTGLEWNHSAIINHYRGWNGGAASHDYNWWDATQTYPTAPGDGHGHGTHTTGTMVGDDGAGNQIGVAPGAKTVHCKNMDNTGNGNDFTFTECFEWDLAPWDLNRANHRPDLAPDAVNNSWGQNGGNYSIWENEITALQAAGILIEVSAGNEGAGCWTLRSPSDYRQVLTTGSVNHSNGNLPGTLSGFSSRGPSDLYPNPPDYFPDVMAPGENIRSSIPGGGYDGTWSGTSMAGPHVIGLVGLLWSVNETLRGDIAKTTQIIQETSVPLTGQTGSNCGGDYTNGPNNDWGYGTIDALAAFNMANPDQHEPNNSISTAFPIEFGDIELAYIDPAGDQDWYRVPVSSSGEIDVYLTSIPLDQNFDLYLYNSSGTKIGESRNPTGSYNEEIIMSLSSTGDYYILVQGENGSFHHTDSYIMYATFKEPTSDYEYGGSTMTSYVPDYDPWLPVDSRDIFYDYETAYHWLELRNLYAPVQVREEWYTPRGALYSAWESNWTDDPKDYSYDYWDWWRFFSSTSMPGGCSTSDCIDQYEGYWFVAYLVKTSGTDYQYLGSDSFYLELQDPPPPSVPTGVAASDGSYTDRVHISWNSVSDATSYTVYRAGSPTETKSELGSTSNTYFDDTSAQVDYNYYYWVKARNAYGESDYSSYDFGYRADGVPPTIQITSPTSGSSYSTSSSPITIAGSASDDIDVSHVTWSNNRGGDGYASGAESWSASIGLYDGDNILTVTAWDTYNNSVSDTLTVSYTAPVQSYSVTLNVLGKGSGSVSGAGTYETGSLVTLIASFDPASVVFAGWYGGPCSGTATTCSFEITSDVTISAAFSKVFTDDPVKAYNPSTGEFTQPKWEHITQLRDAINDIRALHNKSEYISWPTHDAEDPNLFWGDYITTLRNVVQQTYSDIGKTFNRSWTDPDIPADQIGVRAVHVNELRDAIEDLRQ